MQQLFQSDIKKHYYLLSESEIEEKRKAKGTLVLKDCQKFHMTAFHLNGSVQTKVNMCSCDDFLKGNFIDCLLKPGNMLSHGQLGIHKSDSESDEEFEYEDDDMTTEADIEAYELRADCVFNVLQRGSFIALFLHSSSFKLFYLCKVLEFGTATEDMIDPYNYQITIGTKYILCNYLEKIAEKKNSIIYKILSETVLILPAQVMSPMVHSDDNLSSSSA